MQRLLAAPTGSPLYALAWTGAQGGLLGAAGAERAVQLIDPRRWGPARVGRRVAAVVAARDGADSRSAAVGGPAAVCGGVSVGALRPGRLILPRRAAAALVARPAHSTRPRFRSAGEPRWRCLDKWGGAARQAIHHLSFPTSAPEYACASGLDSEVVCGCWAAPPPPVAVKPYTVAPSEADKAGADGGGGGGRGGEGAAGGAFSYRGDSRWLGVAKAAGADVLAGFSASGRVTYARIEAGAGAGGGSCDKTGPAGE